MPLTVYERCPFYSHLPLTNIHSLCSPMVAHLCFIALVLIVFKKNFNYRIIFCNGIITVKVITFHSMQQVITWKFLFKNSDWCIVYVRMACVVKYKWCVWCVACKKQPPVTLTNRMHSNLLADSVCCMYVVKKFFVSFCFVLFCFLLALTHHVV